MHLSEKQSGYSEKAVKRFYDWMYRAEPGKVQICAFPVPTENVDKHEMGKGKWKIVDNYDDFREFAYAHSDTWQYHVYSAVNKVDSEPDTGRGGIDCFNVVDHLSFDIETERDSYSGASREEVWWCYKYGLAQAKYMKEEWDVLPLVVMSENGIHLHYRVDFLVEEDKLYGKQHIYSKYLTHKARNSKYAKKIEEQCPDDITFDQDDVSDVPRVMKVAGTMGIKSENGRMCGIIHEPDDSEASIILGDEIEVTDDELKEMTDDNGSSGKDREEVEVTPDDADADVLERVKHLCKNDQEFRKFWTARHEKCSDMSEAEFAFILKLLNHGFGPDEVNQVMWASALNKWDDEGDHYREKTLNSALEYFDGTVVNDSTNGKYSFDRA